MTETTAEAPATILRLSCEQRLFPPYDGFHGTPNPMLWRKVTIETPLGIAAFEQTDYGHPGRLNPWDPRGIATPLVPKLAQLRALAEACGALI
jgi:hypothetical protein